MNHRMKKLFVTMLVAALALAAWSMALGEAGLANPWVNVTAEEVEAAVGVAFGVPEGAESVYYSLLKEENLAEMAFTWYGMEYVARIQPTDGFADISGLYYEGWDVGMDVEIGGCPGTDMRVKDGAQTVNLCQWYDAANGRMYCVFTGGPDLNGFDITAAAEAIFAPAVEGE